MQVLAFGQTGSGKTFSMGTNFSSTGSQVTGVIPMVMHDVCRKKDSLSGGCQPIVLLT